ASVIKKEPLRPPRGQVTDINVAPGAYPSITMQFLYQQQSRNISIPKDLEDFHFHSAFSKAKTCELESHAHSSTSTRI
ncbi:hypothetical protein Dimus_037323, partial [Dionaea muscipula]